MNIWDHIVLKEMMNYDLLHLALFSCNQMDMSLYHHNRFKNEAECD